MDLLKNIGLMSIEDDPVQQETISMILDELGYDHLGTAASAEDGLRLFEDTKPDVVLLDIHLKGKMDGISLGQRIREEYETPLIYITAFDDEKTFKRAQTTTPVAYLIKPIQPLSLQNSIETAIRYADQPVSPLNSTTTSSWDNDIILKDSIFIKIGQKLMRMRCEDILFVETAGNRYCKMTSTSRVAHVRKTLAEIEARLQHYPFFRIHRSFLINLHHIEMIHQGDQTVQVGAHEIPIGESYRTEFMSRIQKM